MQHISILYEDNHLLIVEKPNNIPVQQDKSNDPDLLNLLKQDLKIRYQKPGNVFLGLVHRLDRPVGGVMAFAKTSKAASRLSNLIRMRTFEKKYLAVVHGQPNEDDTLTDYLVKNKQKNKGFVVTEHTPHAKEAILHYHLVESKHNQSLVKIDLVTGRPHQIRIQFASRGYPLYGDQKYGKRTNTPEVLALWSHQLTFNHPVTKESMTFTSLPPQTEPWHIWNRNKL